MCLHVCASTYLCNKKLTRAIPGLDGLAAVGAARVHLARVLSVGADVLEGGGVAVVGVDADDLAAVARGRALDVDVALTLGGALDECESDNCQLSIPGISTEQGKRDAALRE